MITKEQNRKYQKEWYLRQKHKGLVYLITFITGDTYVGKTTNSIKKRMQQHRCCQVLRTNGQDFSSCVVTVLGTKRSGQTLAALERHYIIKLDPPLNYKETSKVKKYIVRMGTGVEYNNVWYPSLKRLWEVKGECPLNTFKSRRRRGFNLDKCLAVSRKYKKLRN